MEITRKEIREKVTACRYTKLYMYTRCYISFIFWMKSSFFPKAALKIFFSLAARYRGGFALHSAE